jgi:two-component system, LytTR family, sensor kinase
LILVTALQQSGINNFIDNIFSPVLFWNQFRVNLLFIGISFAYWFAGKSYRAEKNQQRFEREILAAKLSALKNQINPHFLYNTLSFIYTKSLPFSGQLAGAIAKLSEMMRYSLDETDADGRVSLEQEVLHIKNFIDIQQMRFDDRLNISFTIDGDLHQCRVMPLLLITFVENAFKHGKLNDANYPLYIRLSTVQRLLSFDVRNRKANWKKEEAHGIGLENVRKRLALVYPQQHELNIQDREEEFIVNLKINLHP